MKISTGTMILAPWLLVACCQLPTHTFAFVPSTLPIHHRQAAVFPRSTINSIVSNTQPYRLISIVKPTAVSSTLFGRSRDNVDSRQSAASLLAAWAVHFAHFRHQTSVALKWCKRRAAIALFTAVMAWTLATGAAFAVTGGRSGGSFKRAPMRAPMRSHSRPSPSRSYNAPMRNYNQYRGPPRVMMRPPSRLYYRNPTPTIIVGPQMEHVGPQFQPYGPLTQRRRISLSEVAVITGTGLFIANKVSNKLQEDREQTTSALGPGFTMAKISVSLNVPNRDAPDSILKTLQEISSTSRTNTREGVQQLISKVALEMLRQEKAIQSAESRSAHYKQEGDVERDFLQESVQQRSKFERDFEYKVGNPSSSDQQQQKSEDGSKATEAVVTIIMAIEGDETQLPKIQRRTDVLEALRKLAVDSQVDDCLLSGEVSWSPELRSETLTLTDIYADYPTLFPV